jgi:hypothetical protein
MLLKYYTFPLLMFAYYFKRPTIISRITSVLTRAFVHHAPTNFIFSNVVTSRVKREPQINSTAKVTMSNEGKRSECCIRPNKGEIRIITPAPNLRVLGTIIVLKVVRG